MVGGKKALQVTRPTTIHYLKPLRNNDTQSVGNSITSQEERGTLKLARKPDGKMLSKIGQEYEDRKPFIIRKPRNTTQQCRVPLVF